MKCPHCGIHFHDNWVQLNFERHNGNLLREKFDNTLGAWSYRSAICPSPSCQNCTIEVAVTSNRQPLTAWMQIWPIGVNRGPVPAEVPEPIAQDYIEACNVLPISAKASAALSRRCLQNILHSAGYKAKDLAKEIDFLLAEPDPKKALPNTLRETVDAIRHFGNFSAHPIDDKTTLQIIDVEPHEAEWCLEMIEEL